MVSLLMFVAIFDTYNVIDSCFFYVFGTYILIYN